MQLHQLPSSLITLYPDRWTAPFWDAARDGRLVVAKCGSCARYRMPPSPYCPRCRSQEVDWEHVSGAGSLYSYTVIHQALIPSYKAHVPYAVGVAALDEAPVRLIANVVDIDSEDLAIGMPLDIGWIAIDGGQFPVLRARSEAPPP